MFGSEGVEKLEAPGGFEPPIRVLQTPALPLGDGAGYVQEWNAKSGMEREKGFEPSTSTLARLHSTTELLPLDFLTVITGKGTL